MLLSLVLLACTTKGVIVAGNGGDGSSDTDVTDTDTGGGDTQDTTPPPDPTGHYSGQVSGDSVGDNWEQACTGDVEFDVDSTGNLTGGQMTCVDDWGRGLQGDVVGTVAVDGTGVVNATWTVPTGWDQTQDLPMSGTWDGADTITLHVDADFGWAQFSADAEPTK